MIYRLQILINCQSHWPQERVGRRRALEEVADGPRLARRDKLSKAAVFSGSARFSSSWPSSFSASPSPSFCSSSSCCLVIPIWPFVILLLTFVPEQVFSIFVPI
eukprot:GHVT01082458.1.p1 GENE.GHVT01082458.1~~GHVT01082458.1.p1  ORF type:complete len:104 (+),score=18.19 GHVT01082458.1:230-541(+)